MKQHVGVLYFELSALLNPEHIRYVEAVLLIKNQRLTWHVELRGSQTVFHIYKNVIQAPALDLDQFHGHRFAVKLATHRVKLDLGWRRNVALKVDFSGQISRRDG